MANWSNSVGGFRLAGLGLPEMALIIVLAILLILAITVAFRLLLDNGMLDLEVRTRDARDRARDRERSIFDPAFKDLTRLGMEREQAILNRYLLRILFWVAVVVILGGLLAYDTYR
jgi:hypothetical protein